MSGVNFRYCDKLIVFFTKFLFLARQLLKYRILSTPRDFGNANIHPATMCYHVQISMSIWHLTSIDDQSIIQSKYRTPFPLRFRHLAPSVSFRYSMANGLRPQLDVHHARGPICGCYLVSRPPFVWAHAAVYQIRASIYNDNQT